MSEGIREPAPQSAEPIHPQPATPLPEPVPKKGFSELSQRLFTAAILIPSVVWVIFAGGVLYLAVVMVITLLAQREFYGLIEDKGAHPLIGLGLSAGAAVPVVAYVGNEYHATLLLTASLLVMMVAQLRKAQITEALASISGTFFGVFYVAWLLSHAVVLRNFPTAASAKHDPTEIAVLNLAPESGIFFMLFTLVVVVLCDTGAYFAGRAYGRRKLAPKISPGKTVEGALGGVLLGTLGGLAAKAVFDFIRPDLSAAFAWNLVIPFAIVLSIVGIVGDLVESLLKRDAAVKDTGALLPGMGGVMDRVDAPLLAIPVMYYMLLGYVYVRLG